LLLGTKRNRAVVIAAASLILLSRLVESVWLVMPEFASAPPLWLIAAAIMALGGAMALLFLRGFRRFPLVTTLSEAR
jgi:hypothetical protein